MPGDATSAENMKLFRVHNYIRATERMELQNSVLNSGPDRCESQRAHESFDKAFAVLFPSLARLKMGLSDAIDF